MHPQRIWSNAGARAGDVLFLTKALGTGIIATALKAGRAPESAVEGAVRSMLTLNRAASEALKALPADAIHACTDVTGFGLVGHACEMAAASSGTVRIEAGVVPLLSGVMALVADNVPGGGRTNAQHFGPEVRIDAGLNPDLVAVLHDPQTSGGLLIAANPAHGSSVAAALSRAGVEARQVAEILPGQGCLVILS